uniref:Uncharacterized protein n=1 Tax=Crocodylus porosus TaxID=8502 RepID=A0A7M4FKL4_CROPO
MPVGVSWPRYLKMFCLNMLAMFAGAEVVHRYYRPDLRIILLCSKRVKTKS